VKIENYKDLLFAIFNTEEPIKQKYGVICVYDTKDNEKLVAIFNNATTCGKFFNTTGGCINDNISRKQLRCARYRIERVVLGGD